MWQASMMPLATLFRTPHPSNPFGGQPRLAEWLAAAMSHTLDRQHRNGAFDSVAPFSQDHGVTLAMVLSLCTTAELLGEALPAPLRARTLEGVARACRFAEASSEDYAFISNHQALFALAWQRAARATGEARLLGHADAVIAQILAHQSPDGWFVEYGGPDPGYESFGLTYLAQAEAERPNPTLREAIGRSVAFLAHAVHPDGSIGGGYGSRNTAQYAPGGLEILAPRLPLAAAIADFVGGRLADGNVVTPARCDDDNLPLLTWSYAVAASHARPRTTAVTPLPCERVDLTRFFEDSRVIVASTQHYYAVANLAKGGVVRVFDRARGSLSYEDGGYLLGASGREWSSQLPGEAPSVASDSAGSWTVAARLGAVKRTRLTPAKFLLLRCLNLTVFRSVRLGAIVRRMIIAKLITGREPGRWTLRRTIVLAADRVILRDEVVPAGATRVAWVSLERDLLPRHMGSAKYFHAHELATGSLPALDGWAEALSAGRPASLAQEIEFGERGGPFRHSAGSLPRTATGERTTA